ncbi:hypothetical protein [Actinoplanes sp. G11-F43]|uniref:hypothetical protein n=1 Tax=Actinoplanes sp. G11-F43 TaxID=3424130 RepID=UPI003D34B172
MTGRILWTELRRGTPPLAFLLTMAAMTWMLLVHQDGWVGQWTGLATYLRVSLLILGPLFVAAGAWQAGRERRRQLAELLSSLPRPVWQPMVTAWAAVTVAGLAGLVPPLAVAAVLTGVRATWTGTGWWWIVVTAVVALGTASALGVLVGRLLPMRVVAPVAGVVTYVALGVPMYLDGTRWSAASPVLPYARPADVWPAGFHAWQVGWLIALAVLMLTLAARNWRSAVVPGVLASALLVVPPPSEPGTDAGATALVCTSAGPEICVIRAHAFMLPAVAAALAPGMNRLAGVPGAPTRAVQEPARDPGALEFSLLGQATLSGRLARPDWIVSNFGQIFNEGRCPDQTFDTTWQVTGDAIAWLEGRPTGKPVTRTEAAQKQWVGEVLAASRACDPAGLLRNTLGCIGLIAGAAALIGARLAWLPAFGYICAVYAARPPRTGGPAEIWAWPVQPSTAPLAWIPALAVFTAGAGYYILRGSRGAKN